jgi:hypothetical protein
MLVVTSCMVGIPMCHIFACNILVTRDLGRILVIFTSCLVWQVSHPVLRPNQMLIVCMPRIKLSYIRSECKHRIPMSLL